MQAEFVSQVWLDIAGYVYAYIFWMDACSCIVKADARDVQSKDAYGEEKVHIFYVP